MTSGTLVLGVLNGFIIGLLAVGLVLVYRSNRFLNLVHAQLGAVPAVLLAKFVIDWGWSWWAAIFPALAVGVLTGALVDRLVIARIRRRTRSTVSLLLATIGVTQLLLALTYIPAIGPDNNKLDFKGYPLPFQSHVSVGQVVLGGQYVLILILVPVLVAALGLFLRYTMLGKAIRAAASNADAARLCGVSTWRVSTITWGIAGALSAITAVLQAPSQGSFNAEALGPELLLLALGAAAFGAFVSIPGALVGGLALGLAQQLTLAQTSSGGDAELVVFAVILAIILIRGRAIAAVFASSGAVVDDQPPARVPEVLRARAVVARRGLWSGGLFLAVAALFPRLPYFNTNAHTFELVLVVLFALIGVAMTTLVGWGGQVSLGHFALVGVGAFITARFGPHNWSLVILLLFAGVVGAGLMVVVGLPALRVRGLTLAVTSLGLAVVAPDWLFRQAWFGSSQPFGVQVNPPILMSGLPRPTSQLEVYYVSLAVLVLVLLAVRALRRSVPGRLVIAVRDNERAASAFGVTPATVKLAVLALSGFIAAMAGVLWADAWRTVSAEQFDPNLSLGILAIPVIGGLGSAAGAVAGAVLIYVPAYFVSPFLTGLFGQFGHQIGFELALQGLALTGVLLSYPTGVAGAARRGWEAFLSRLARDYERRPPPEQFDTTLVVEDVGLRFGGVQALAGASIVVRPGEIVGLIGPNGAGKTTLMNVISGVLQPTSGSVCLRGQEMVGLPAEFRAAFGLGRSFQDALLFPGLTVTETIQVALSSENRVGFLSASVGAPWARAADAETAARTRKVVERLGLSAWADTLTSELSTGTRRICDLAAQVAAGPAVLLLDEPTAGVAQREAEAFGPLLRRIRDELDCSILIVEHDMPLLMGLCDRVYAMEAGKVIAEGTPEEIRADPAVIAIYLGTDEVAVARSGTRRSRSTRRYVRT
ncbi:MAG TPA: ATP-binding cassette domain-containing protein [Acidimicrobiales bacterium]|nr:ATP-binding cassette domain-containing protein [Acidimicrobiales bacterium]